MLIVWTCFEAHGKRKKACDRPTYFVPILKVGTLEARTVAVPDLRARDTTTWGDLQKEKRKVNAMITKDRFYNEALITENWRRCKRRFGKSGHNMPCVRCCGNRGTHPTEGDLA